MTTMRLEDPSLWHSRTVTYQCAHMDEPLRARIPELLYEHPALRAEWFRGMIETARRAVGCQCGDEILERYGRAP